MPVCSMPVKVCWSGRGSAVWCTHQGCLKHEVLLCRWPGVRPALCLPLPLLLLVRSAGKLGRMRSWRKSTKLEGHLHRRGPRTSKSGEEKACTQVCGKRHIEGSRQAWGHGRCSQGCGPWERTNARSYTWEGDLYWCLLMRLAVTGWGQSPEGEQAKPGAMQRGRLLYQTVLAEV